MLVGSSQPYHIVVEGARGDEAQSDVAIDDVSFTPECATGSKCTILDPGLFRAWHDVQTPVLMKTLCFASEVVGCLFPGVAVSMTCLPTYLITWNIFFKCLLLIDGEPNFYQTGICP